MINWAERIRSHFMNFESSQRGHQVHGKKDENPLGGKPPANEQERVPLTPEQIEAYKQQAQEWLDSYAGLFTTFAKDVSLKFTLSDAFYINLEKGEINLDARWFAERGFSKEQIFWAVLHELTHFRDLAEDPQGTKDNFEYIIQQAKRTARVMRRKLEDTFGVGSDEVRHATAVPAGKKGMAAFSPIEQAAYKCHHLFFNCLDDIYVNTEIPRRAPVFQKGNQGKVVQDLYRKQLFPGLDYTKSPQHMQLVYKLLREVMVPEEEVNVNSDVLRDAQVSFYFNNNDYSPQELIGAYIVPSSTNNTEAGERHRVLRETLEPRFVELLMRDIEDWQPQKPEDKKDAPSDNMSGEGEEENDGQPTSTPPNGGVEMPFAQAYKDFETRTPDQISETDMQEWKAGNEEAFRQRQEEARAAAKKAQDEQAAIDKPWLDKIGVSQAEMKRFRDLQRQVQPYLQDLSRLWRHLVHGESREMRSGMEGHFKTGSELDIAKVVEAWPQIDKGRVDDARIMKRMMPKEVAVSRPELIRFRVVGDVSGSMNGPKLDLLRQTMVLLLSSLEEFNQHLNMTRVRTKSKMQVDTEAWKFGNHAQKIKGFRQQSRAQADQAEVVRVFTSLDSAVGSTNDADALATINQSFSPQDLKSIREGKIMEIIFEVTDGVSDAPVRTRQEVDRLLAAGVIIRAFQIGRTTVHERRPFNEVWNKNRERPLGMIIGEDIEKLLPAVVEALSEHLKNVRL